MNKLKKLMESLESNYKVDTTRIVENYAKKLSVEEIAKIEGVTPYTVSTVLQHLQLKRPKNKRDLCVKEHYAMLEEDTIDEYVEEVEEDNEILTTKIARLTRQLQNARDELNVQRKLVNGIVKGANIEDRLLEAFEARLTDPVKHVYNFEKPNKTELQKGLCLALSDLHIGEVVGKDVVQNKFDYKIALTRLDKVLQELLVFPKQSKEITVLQCGDILKGIIHGGLFTAEDSFIDSMIKAVDFLMYIYRVLSEVYDRVHIYSITGNHDRITEDPATANKALDFTRLIDKFIARQIQAEGLSNIVIHITDVPYFLININGANLISFHGDTVRKYQPSDANQRSLLQDLCIGTFGTNYKHAVSGHTHQFMACLNQYNGMSISNGTLVGSNAFGTSNGMRDIAATQTIFYVNGEGDIDLIKPVILN